MAQILKNVTVRLSFDALTENSLDLGGLASHRLPKSYQNVYTNGTGNNQANRFYGDQITINAASTVSVDFAGGLANPLNGNESISTVKELILSAPATNPGVVKVGGNANAFDSFLEAGGVLLLPPGGKIVLSAPLAGFAVTAGTGDILDFENEDVSDPATVDIILVGLLAV